MKKRMLICCKTREKAQEVADQYCLRDGEWMWDGDRKEDDTLLWMDEMVTVTEVGSINDDNWEKFFK